jgi:hypothetical protein
LPVEVNSTSKWDPIAVAREADVQRLFNQFIKKMEFTIPSDTNTFDAKNPIFDPLYCMLHLQHSLLHGFIKRMNDHLTKIPSPGETPTSSTQSTYSSGEAVGCETSAAGYPEWNSSAAMTTQAHQRLVEQFRANPIPLLNSFHFNSINFDTIPPPDLLPMPPLLQHDLLWDTVMDDFTFP